MDCFGLYSHANNRIEYDHGGKKIRQFIELSAYQLFKN